MTVSEQRAPATPAPLPARALDTSAEHPWPVRLLSAKIADYVDKMAPVWVEGQVVQLNRRPGTSQAYLTLRDTDQDMSLPVTVPTRILDGSTTQLAEGAHVVVHAKPVFWTKRGTLQLQARDVRTVGIGELLARIEHLKRILAAEGLFDAERKVALPFLPRVIGLVCGRESKAEHDVVVNAHTRWPQARFEIREVAVQGAAAVTQVSAAIAELDANPDVEVIVVARGGGAVEDLLPFSNEALVRAAAACRTPLVSAIGHETDCPLLDLVADYRASTPTDAAKRIVPDVAQERAGLLQARARMQGAITAWVTGQQLALDAIRTRPALAAPHVLVDAREQDLFVLRDQGHRALATVIAEGTAHIVRLEAQVRALSPASTLERGYAVVQGPRGIVRSATDVEPGNEIHIRVADGAFDATVAGTAQPAAAKPVAAKQARTKPLPAKPAAARKTKAAASGKTTRTSPTTNPKEA